MLIGRDVQQPREVLSRDVSFAKWLPDGDQISSAEVSLRRLRGDGADPLVVDTTNVSTTVVQVWLSGGTAGDKWRVEVLATTAAGRKREAEFDIEIEEV